MTQREKEIETVQREVAGQCPHVRRSSASQHLQDQVGAGADSCPHPTSGSTSHREQSPKAGVITFLLTFLLHSGHPPTHCYKEALRFRETKSCAQAHTASSAKKGASNWLLGLGGEMDRWRTGAFAQCLPKTHQDPLSFALEGPPRILGWMLFTVLCPSSRSASGEWPCEGRL